MTSPKKTLSPKHVPLVTICKHKKFQLGIYSTFGAVKDQKMLRYVCIRTKNIVQKFWSL